MILAETDRFEFVVATPEYEQRCREVVSEGFSYEPGAVFLEPDQPTRYNWFYNFVGFFSEECCSSGLSIMCKEKSSGNVAGVVFIRDFKLPSPENFSTEGIGLITHSLEVLKAVGDKYEEFRPNLQIGQCVDLMLLAVHSDYRRQGIADRLTAIGCEHVRTKGFSYVVLEASGAYSAKCAESAGMTKVAAVKSEEVNPVFHGMPEIHSHFTFWEKVL